MSLRWIRDTIINIVLGGTSKQTGFEILDTEINNSYARDNALNDEVVAICDTVSTLTTTVANKVPYGFGIGERITPLVAGSAIKAVRNGGQYLVQSPSDAPESGTYWWTFDVAGGNTLTTITAVKHEPGATKIFHTQTTNNGTAWSAWRQIATTDMTSVFAPAGYGLGGFTASLSAIDLNTVAKTGMYYCFSCTNTPDGGNGFLFAEVTNSSYQTQKFVSVVTGNIYIRTQSSTWSAWKQIATTSTPTFDGAVKVNGDTNNDCIYLYSNAGVKETIIGSSDVLPFYVYDVKNTKFAFRWAGTTFGINAPIVPYVDNAYTLGVSAARWSVVYAATSTISTSDANLKQQITDLSDTEKAVATKLKTLIKKFKFNDSVAEKGDKARWHIGVIAQEVREAFEEHGLDVSDYGLFCSDTWYELDGETVDAGTEGAEEKTRLSIRYEELLAFIISAL